MKVISDPNEYTRQPKDVICYLGGDENNTDWCNKVIDALIHMEKDNPHEHLVVINPLGGEPAWQYQVAEECDIYSMYFTSAADQFMCVYQLGRNLVRMREKYPISFYERLVIGTEAGYLHSNDVAFQTKMAVGWNIVDCSTTPRKHAHEIIMAYTWATEDL